VLRISAGGSNATMMPQVGILLGHQTQQLAIDQSKRPGDIRETQPNVAKRLQYVTCLRYGILVLVREEQTQGPSGLLAG
jgi:hypothetical protein